VLDGDGDTATIQNQRDVPLSDGLVRKLDRRAVYVELTVFERDVEGAVADESLIRSAGHDRRIGTGGIERRRSASRMDAS